VLQAVLEVIMVITMMEMEELVAMVYGMVVMAGTELVMEPVAEVEQAIMLLGQMVLIRLRAQGVRVIQM
jgi:hypothetical protein